MTAVEIHNQRPSQLLNHMFEYGMKHIPQYALHLVALTALARSSAYVHNPKVAIHQLFWEMDQSTIDTIYDAWERAYTDGIAKMNTPHDYDAVRKKYRKV